MDKENRLFVQVFKDITELHGYLLVSKGIYELNTFKKYYPFFDINNKESEWFKIIEIMCYPVGTPVRYGSYEYEISGISNGVSYTTYLKQSVEVKEHILFPIYTIVPLTEAYMKSKVEVTELEFTILENYWYVSSGGKVKQGFIGNNPEEEEWRKNHNNYFRSYEEAAEERELIEGLIKLQDFEV